jgi:hypothetical protein
MSTTPTPTPTLPKAVKKNSVLVNFWLDLPTYYRLRKLPQNRSQFFRQAVRETLPKAEQEAKAYFETINQTPQK